MLDMAEDVVIHTMENEAVIVPRVRFVASMVIVLALVISVLIKNFLVESKI